MYVRTSTAAWWQEPSQPQTGTLTGTPLSASNTPSLNLADHLLDRTTRWAARPLKLHLVTCHALRMEDGVVRVCVQRRNKREWLPAASLLSVDQLVQWLNTGFVGIK